MGQVLSTRVASAAYGTGSGPGGSDLVTTDLAIQGKLALSGASGATPPSPTTTTIDAPGGNGFRIGTAAMSGGTNGWAAFGGNVWSDDLNWHAIDPSKRFSVLYCPAPYPEVMQIRQSLTPSDTVNTLARLYVSSGGNVGINTGMPQATLHVGGDLKVDGAFLGTASQAYYAP